MYGWLLESVQHFIVQECGEEIWETILRDAGGARCAVFSARQQYPDALMLRLASALSRLITKDPTTPTTSTPGSPAPRKQSFKAKPSWRSASVHTDGRATAYRCPFTATNALTAATKKEIDAYNSSEEIHSHVAKSTDRIHESKDPHKTSINFNRRSLAITFEDRSLKEVESSEVETGEGEKICKNVKASETNNTIPGTSSAAASTASGTRSPIYTVSLPTSAATSPTSPATSPKPAITWPKPAITSPKPGIISPKPAVTLPKPAAVSPKSTTTLPNTSATSPKPAAVSPKPDATVSKPMAISPKTSATAPTSTATSPEFECPKRNSMIKPAIRKTSCTVALDVYQRRSSVTPVRQRHNSISLISADKLNSMREKFGTPEKAMHFFGRCFVKFFSNYGYDTMIRATGRYFCTFLQSVDNIHQRMRFTFPRMRSPSMQLTRAHRHGAELVYSSGRTGFTHYLMGQLYEIAEDIFSLKLKVSVVKESMEGNYYVAVLRLEFDNSDYVQSLMLRKSLPCPLPPVPASLLLQLFPFGVMLCRRMKVLMAGDKLVEAWGGPYKSIVKQPISEILRLRKPKIAFTWDKVVCMQTVLFELELMRWRARGGGDARRGSQGARSILLKGPIHLLEEIDALIFLCSPIFNDMEELHQAGLFVADLNGHGMSKELLLQGWQHLSKLELLFERAEGRCTSLEKSCRLRDQWKKRGDQLLYSMIPKPIVDHLRAGKDAMAACQAFDCVTIMFCGVQLSEAGSRADVMQTVAYMNDLYSRIDRLLDNHRVYKVETVGTVYMLVSGAPERQRAHAGAAAGAALAIARALPMLTIGIHSGPCVAGVLGLRLPRYCLVGDSVNTASRMQTTSEPGRIQISAKTAAQLPAGRFRLRRRGLIKVKGKGMMETFWLEGEVEEEEQDEALQLFSALCGDN